MCKNMKRNKLINELGWNCVLKSSNERIIENGRKMMRFSRQNDDSKQ